MAGVNGVCRVLAPWVVCAGIQEVLIAVTLLVVFI